MLKLLITAKHKRKKSPCYFSAVIGLGSENRNGQERPILQ
jgi:hypothetical protein